MFEPGCEKLEIEQVNNYKNIELNRKDLAILKLRKK